jgi:hypothetical protein
MAFVDEDLMLELRCISGICPPFSLSEEEEFVLLTLRRTPARPTEGLRDREPVLGLLVVSSSSKHDVHPTGRPSVTINGVGPCVSQ